MRAALALAALLLARPADPEPRKANRLAAEKSPYLLQHAHNPVDWFPWGEEAFRKARAEDKPVFLSIGYSTCHWCHVMERESFENQEIARVLNLHFVAVKVDREERPDVDEVYMQAVQAITGQGGWPLSVFLTPEGKPFFGGTYFPPEDDPARGRGFRTLLLLVARTWKEERAKLVEGSDRIASHLREAVEGAAAKGASLAPNLLERGLESFAKLHDPVHGGFGRAPKFPRTSVLEFLMAMSLRPPAREGSAPALPLAISTLDHMAAGGIRDHLAGGFHRYSTDREWTVPHFEKMLYDQALIARAYLDAGRLTGEERHTAVARGILDYVLARLTHPEGGFLSAEDADSEGVEGKCYVWTREEVLERLGEEEGKLLCDFHGVAAEGNFEGTPQNVLTARVGLEELAAKAGIKPEDLRAKLAAGRRKLLQVRDRRIPPLKDDKVLADWNGLMISSFAVAHQATGEPRYLQAAERAADFIHRRMTRDGRLLHRFRDGEAAIPGFLEDHAFLCLGLLDLYEAGFELARLKEAVR
ncbi:MAG: thioredoxin domain-containing protein, partial [Thermoanaerobaculia bacterium]